MNSIYCDKATTRNVCQFSKIHLAKIGFFSVQICISFVCLALLINILYLIRASLELKMFTALVRNTSLCNASLIRSYIMRLYLYIGLGYIDQTSGRFPPPRLFCPLRFMGLFWFISICNPFALSNYTHPGLYIMTENSMSWLKRPSLSNQLKEEFGYNFFEKNQSINWLWVVEWTKRERTTNNIHASRVVNFQTMHAILLIQTVS